jgi:hypothetical protein
MSDLLFSKLIPGGNATILLHEPAIPFGSLPHIAKRLMDPMHIQAEQVGALYARGQSIPQLEMMGGEFCVNATRAATLILHAMGLLASVPVSGATVAAGLPYSADALDADGKAQAWQGRLLVSGMPEPVEVLACEDARTLALYLAERSATHGGRPAPGRAAHEGKGQAAPSAPAADRAAPALPVEDWQDALPASLYCAARVACAPDQISCREIGQGVCLVRMPGMSHLLIDADTHPRPSLEDSLWKQAAASWRVRCGLDRAPASGVVWHERQGKSHRIWPAVEVRASGSEHMETACGSASLALALWEQKKSLRESGITVSCPYPALDIIQPSGESLLVFLEFPQEADATPFPASAWIAGPVQLAALGRAFI